jgi:hypothetical protein
MNVSSYDVHSYGAKSYAVSYVMTKRLLVR